MKRIIISLAVVGAVAAAVVAGTTAFFSSTQTSAGNIITTGTIKISVDEQSTWDKTYTDQLGDMKPGYTRYINFVVQNTGANPARVWKQLTNMVSPTNLQNVITYDMYVCKLSQEGECTVDANGKQTGAGWKQIVSENDGITLGDVENAYIDLLQGGTGANKFLGADESLKGGPELSHAGNCRE